MIKRVLVTGAEGFIGSHFCELLVKEGFQVRAMVLYNSFGLQGWLDSIDPRIKQQMEIFWGDVRDATSVNKAVHGCDAVVHLAALIGIPYSYHNPDSYVQTNVVGTLNVLQAARNFDIVKVIHTSTSEVYGTAQFVPITEIHPIHAQSPYAATKVAADQLALSFYRSFNTPIVVVRPFNTYGPRQSLRAVIPTIITQLIKGETHLKLGALTPTRDFSFVGDTTCGILAALKSENLWGEIVNIGSGFEISIEDTAKAIAKTMNVEINIEVTENRLRPKASEVDRLYADITKARSLLSWSPRYEGVSGFLQGIEITTQWFMQKDHIKHYTANAYMI